MSADERLYWYAAQLNPTHRDPSGVVDGDTINAVVDFGAFIYVHKPLRMYGINAPEMSTPEGKLAKQWAIAWFVQHCPDSTFVMHSSLPPEDKYGRLLANVFASDGACFNYDIVAAGHAVVYLP